MIPPFVDHLWLSTLFVAAAWLLTLALQKNRAQVRYWIWFVGSVKFLVPFSLLVELGSLVPRHAAAPPVQAPWVVVVEQIGEPLTALPAVGARVAVSSDGLSRTYFAVAALAVWGCGFAAIAICWLARWRRVQALRNLGTPMSSADFDVPIMSAPGLIGPGIFGVLRPVLLLPEGITEQLDRAQLDAILAHELCHVRRHDNLTAMIHMAAQAIFWFHPLVWWVGSHLVEEREHACDEEVLRLGNKPRVYAEGILNVYKLYVESPLACVSGVTGSNLRRRIEGIMNHHIVRNLTVGKKLLLGGAGTLAMVVPIVVGVLNAPSLRAQSTAPGSQAQPRPAFEVATVKLVDRNGPYEQSLDEGRAVNTANLYTFIVWAYDLINPCNWRVAGGGNCPLISGTLPAWAKTDVFQIQGKLPAGFPSYTGHQFNSGQATQLYLVLQSVLEERFKLKLHRETRDLPVYALTVGKSGMKLKRTTGPRLVQSFDGSSVSTSGMTGRRLTPSLNGNPTMQMDFTDSSMRQLVDGLAGYMDRPVLDQTGLKGNFDFTIKYEIDASAPGGDSTGGPPNVFGGQGMAGPALFTAMQEQLGLKLESTKGPVEVLVIDYVERPSEN